MTLRQEFNNSTNISKKKIFLLVPELCGQNEQLERMETDCGGQLRLNVCVQIRQTAHTIKGPATVSGAHLYMTYPKVYSKW